MKANLKARQMAELMVGVARFDRNRRPDNLEVTLIGAFGAGVSEINNNLIISSAEVAAGLPEESEAVSLVSSIVATMATVFPQEVLLKDTSVAMPPFLARLDAKTAELNATADRPNRTQPEYERRRNWYWGNAVGVLQIIRWANFDAPDEEIGRKAFSEALKGSLVPHFLRLLSLPVIVKEMPEELFIRTAEIIRELQRYTFSLFPPLVRQIGQQRRTLRFSPFGTQLYKELMDRFWHTSTLEDKEAMIKGWEPPD